jgi:hypothetical protein
VENSLGQSEEETDHQLAHSVLARHLQNPSQKYVSAVKHVWRYLYGTRHLAIRVSQQIAEGTSYVWDKSLLYGASDAAFADDVESRRSYHGYLARVIQHVRFDQEI